MAINEESAVLAANRAYYRAFERGDFDAMAAIWADDEVSCVHPGWPALVGRRDVLESYRLILANPDQEPVTCDQETVILGNGVARVLCVESVGGASLAATNLFVLSGDGWRVTHHHASPIALRVERGGERRLN